jgi:GntR family transcriptional regulator
MSESGPEPSDLVARPRDRVIGTGHPQAPLRGDGKGDQLVEILEHLVEAGQPGDLLPSERELAARYGVARMTVRGAISTLVAQGLVHRVQGQGTFISTPRIAQPSTLTSFSEDMRARGMTPSSIVLGQEVLPASGTVALHLEVPTGEPVVRLERIRLGDGDPIAVERAHLPLQRFPQLDEIDLAATSLYDTLAERYDCRIATSQQRIAAVQLSATDAHLLRSEPAVPALRIERVTRTRDGEVVEFVRSLYRGDRYELHTEQHRDPSPVPPQRREGPGSTGRTRRRTP